MRVSVNQDEHVITIEKSYVRFYQADGKESFIFHLIKELCGERQPLQCTLEE